jgi:hypothetical protein
MESLSTKLVEESSSPVAVEMVWTADATVDDVALVTAVSLSLAVKFSTSVTVETSVTVVIVGAGFPCLVVWAADWVDRRTVEAAAEPTTPVPFGVGGGATDAAFEGRPALEDTDDASDEICPCAGLTGASCWAKRTTAATPTTTAMTPATATDENRTGFRPTGNPRK